MTRQIKLLFLFLFVSMITCAQTTGTAASGNAVLYKNSRRLHADLRKNARQMCAECNLRTFGIISFIT